MQGSLRVEDGVVRLEGDLTLAHATRLLAEGKAAIQAGARGVDLSGAGQLDSSAISLLLCLRRHAQASGVELELRALPESLLSLAKLYGVDEHL
ncbi:MAG: STAS domain-containing protein [Pseudomonadota bacterium]